MLDAGTLSRSGEVVRVREISINDFTEKKSTGGPASFLFAKIDEDQPGTLYDIRPIPYEEQTFDEIFVDLFGEDL